MDPTVIRRRGFSLAEILLALGLITIVVLTLLALSLQSLKTNQKINDTTAGQLVAEQVLERIAYQAESSNTAAVWPINNPLAPYSADQVTVGDSVFNVTVYATDVTDSSGLMIAPKRLKELDATVIWQNDQQGKAGQGNLRIQATRLVHEP